ncbi:zinc finger MYM-type protein 1-like [Olea europaea var. sylvestris]|uniref:zinc finger MYM-type protein 1-like n=1 Tax=Olea europaea var. sylvestris TaxID=158386 RepID=UPI000C1D6D38|nr:zinc finger MYM-type protein 1-like [Olea europaea var. sylvestris]
MEKYFKRTSTISCDEQNIGERNVRKKRDEKDVGDVDVDVGFGDIGDVGNVEDIGDIGDSRGNVEDIGDVGHVGDVDVAQPPSDPGLRVPIQNYDVNIRDVIRTAYMQRGPCQPRNHIFPPTRIGKIDRRFCVSWYNEHPTWLEYSIAKDAIFCFYCYLFGLNDGSFVKGGFSNWKKKEYIRKHVGASSSSHNQARVKYELFNNQEQRMAFRGHDESEDSNNQGNFLELLHWLCDHNPEIKAVALTNAPENLKLTSPRVQKDIVSAIASECLHVIIENIRDSFFSILVDESRDTSMKEQMSVVIRYVKNGCILEHFIGVIHVLNTTAASLKAAID